MADRQLVRFGLIVSIGLWTSSLFLPALTLVFDVDPVTFEGWKVLGNGWYFLLALQTGWLANLSFWALVLLLGSRRRHVWPLIVAAATLVLFSLHSLDLLRDPEFYDFREAHGGYFLWMAANTALTACAAFVAWQRARHSRQLLPNEVN